MDKDRILTIPELMVHLKYKLQFQTTHSLLLLRNESIRKKCLTTSNIKLVDYQYTPPCQETFKISKTLAQETPEMLSATEILSDSTVKRLVVK